MPTDPILFWNEVALEVHRRDFAFDPGPDGRPIPPQQGGPTRTSRALAIVHLAMYDAFRAQPPAASYLGQALVITPVPGVAAPPVAAGANPDSAVAGAAAATLRHLFPRQSTYIESRMAQFFAGLPVAVPTVARLAGLKYGQAVGDAMVKFRESDGSAAADAYERSGSYQPGSLPGNHRADPTMPEQGFLGPRWGTVIPFVLPAFAPGANTSAYLPAPPAFNSPAYLAAFNEVRDRGAVSRGLRTAAQEEVGIYWAYDGAKNIGTPPRLYNQIVRTIAADQPNTPAQNARLFALVNAGMADAGIVAWRAKYEHDFWRPSIGVREDDSGTGPTGLGTGSAAIGDPFWRAYGAPKSNEPGAKNSTPNFPAYPSGHATFGTTVFQLVANFYGVAPGAKSFSFLSDELNGRTLETDGTVRTAVTHPRTLAAAITENLESRIWLGVHWRFDGEGGQQAGTKVATTVFASPLIP